LASLGLKYVVVNKVDKWCQPDKVVNAAFDLFDKLGATDERLDFPVVYAPASTAGRHRRAVGASSGVRYVGLFNIPC
jgi:predicted membrane GTPase involved in stress response